MPSKYYLRQFHQGHYYHIFNRGAYKHDIFLNKQDYKFFTVILSYYLNYPKIRPLSYLSIVKNPFSGRLNKIRNLYMNSLHLIAYTLMPNHFHLLIYQNNTKANISDLMRRLTITYAMYFQKQHQHSGTLFQGRYKNVLVESEEQLLYLSKYIHLNPQKLTKKLANYPHSSYPTYIGQTPPPKWLHREYIFNLPYFTNSKNPEKKYQQFVEHEKDKPSLIKGLILE